MVKVLSQEVTSLSLKQRKKSNMDLMHLLFRKPLPPQISPFQETCKYFMSYQNSIVLDEKTEPEKYIIFAYIPIISPHTRFFWYPRHKVHCVSTSGSSGVAVLTQDRYTGFPGECTWAYCFLIRRVLRNPQPFFSLPLQEVVRMSSGTLPGWMYSHQNTSLYCRCARTFSKLCKSQGGVMSTCFHYSTVK